MTEGAIEDRAFEDILLSPGIPLSNYRFDPPTATLIPNATTYPQFFNQNLVNDNRIIKQFLNNTQSNIRIFYYQLFRLGFECQTENNQGRSLAISFRRLVFYSEFEILFTYESENQRDVYNNHQFKRFFAEFFQLLSSTPNVNVEKMINTYPIIDQVMVHILRSILLNQGINQQFTTFIPTETVFGEFSSIIGLSITSYGNCWKFQDSDMFCYEENDRAIYLAYILDNPPQAEPAAEMVSVNYYEDITASRLDGFDRKVETRSNEYAGGYGGAQTVTSNYQSYQPSHQANIQSVYVSPDYSSIPARTSDTYSKTPTYTDNYTTSSYTGAQPTDTYTTTPYTAPLYSTDTYTTNYNPLPVTDNYTSSYTSPTSYLYQAPIATTPYVSSTTTTKQYTSPHSLSSYATTLLGNERKSMTLIEQNPYGLSSNASYKQSNPAKESMISQYFEFEAFTGETTIEKMKVPRSQAGKQSGIVDKPVVYYNREQQFNSMKFGNFGGIAEGKQQNQPIPHSSSPTKYEYPSYNTTSYTYESYTSTTDPISDSILSANAYLQDLNKYLSPTTDPISTGSTESKYGVSAPTTTPAYEQKTYTTSYTSYGADPVSTTITDNSSADKPYDTSYLTSYKAPATTYTSDYTSTYSNSYGLDDYKTTNNYSSTYNNIPTSSDPYASYSLSSTEKKPTVDYSANKTPYTSYSSYTSPQDYTFYSNNPYVAGNIQTTQPQTTTTTTQNRNPYLKDNTSSTDYLSRYGISSPIGQTTNQTQTTFDQSYGQNKQDTKVNPFERTSASEYKPSYAYQTVTYQTEQKPSSSYDKYNYQSFANNPAKTYSNYPSVDYRTQLSSSGIYDIINKVKPVQKPQTAVLHTHSPVKLATHEREQSQYQYPVSSVGGGYSTAPAYVFNYRA